MSLTIPKFALPFSRNSRRRTLSSCPRCCLEAQPAVRTNIGRREGLTALSFLLAAEGAAQQSPDARAMVLEAEDDQELLEKVKNDRKKRLQRQDVISSSAAETGYLQELVYKLSKVGQAIEKSDLSAAGSVLGSNEKAEWVQNINKAFTKLSSSEEEKTEVDMFNSSLSSLISSVGNKDVEASKLAFVSSASTLEKWIDLTGLNAQIKGL